jgi:hypothetical protein
LVAIRVCGKALDGVPISMVRVAAMLGDASVVRPTGLDAAYPFGEEDGARSPLNPAAPRVPTAASGPLPLRPCMVAMASVALAAGATPWGKPSP